MYGSIYSSKSKLFGDGPLCLRTTSATLFESYPFLTLINDLLYHIVFNVNIFDDLSAMILRRGVRSVINIYGLQCDFMQKNRKKHSKSQNHLFYNLNSAPELRNDQKSPKKTDHSIAIYLILCIGMVYFKCLLVNPHVQAVQNMCGKGGGEYVSG